MFSAEQALDTDHEEFQDTPESLAGAVRFLKQHGASGSTDLSTAHLLVRGAGDVESVSSPFLASKSAKRYTLEDPSSPSIRSIDRAIPPSHFIESAPIKHSLKSVVLELCVQTESLDELHV